MGFLSLVAKLGIDISGYETGLKRAESSVSKFSRSANSMLKSQIAGAVSIGALTSAAKVAIDYASHINDVSTRIGIGTEKLQEYAYAAKQTGGSLDDFAGVARKLSQARSEALKDPAGEAAQSFKKLGVSAQELKTLSIDGLIDKIAIAFQNAKNPQDLLVAGFATMGRGALPVIGAMREGLAELAAQAQAAGIVMKDSVVVELDNVGDALDRIKTKATAAFSPLLAKGLNATITAWKSVQTAIGAYLTKTIAKGVYHVSDEEAKKGASEFIGEEVNRAVEEDMALAQTKQKRADAARAISGDFSELGKSKPPSFIKSGANSLQQIGAYSGVDPIVQELKTGNLTAKRTEQNTRKIADASNASGQENWS